MARELSDSALQQVRDWFDDAYILDQVSTGNMTADDAAALFDLQTEEGNITAPETIAALTSITGALDNFVQTSIEDFVQAETLLAENLYGNVMGDYMDFSESIEGMADQLEAFLRNELAFNLGAIDSSLDGLTDAVLGVPKAQVQAIANLEGDLSDKIFGFLGDQSEIILGVLGREAEDILSELSPALDLVQSATDEVVEKTTNFATALRETIPEIGDSIVSAMDGVGEAGTTGF